MEEKSAVTRRKVITSAAWAVPAVAAAVAVPTSSASTGPLRFWNLASSPQCGNYWGWSYGAGHTFYNNGNIPIPAGTTFTWNLRHGVWAYYNFNNPAWPNTLNEAWNKGWVDNSANFIESRSEGVFHGNWSAWYRGENEMSQMFSNSWMPNTLGYWSYKDSQVTYQVPAGGLAPGAEASIYWRTSALWPNFKSTITFTSGNGGHFPNDESNTFQPGLIVGCNVINDPTPGG